MIIILNTISISTIFSSLSIPSSWLFWVLVVLSFCFFQGALYSDLYSILSLLSLILICSPLLFRNYSFMFLEFNSFSFMGFPDSLEKDLHAVECNFLSRPTLEIQAVSQVAPSGEVNGEVRLKNQRVAEFYHDEKKEKEDRSGDVVSSLKVKLPEARQGLTVGDDEEEEEEEEGCTTPTSADHKIPQVCPPAPRKPKSLPSSTNQKASRRRVLLDLSNEIESLFPPALLADFGKKIKKVRKEI